MSLNSGDQVLITNRNDIEATVIGFYAPLQSVKVRTRRGHEWIVSPIFLEKVVDRNNKK